jgi:hypothetical protein
MFDFTASDPFEIEDAVWVESAPSARPASQSDATGQLDTLSQRVVHLARAEAHASRPARGLGATLGRWLLGPVETPRPLANPALETLRRFCISVRLGEGESQELAQVLLAKGHYDPAQLETARVMSLAA